MFGYVSRFFAVKTEKSVVLPRTCGVCDTVLATSSTADEASGDNLSTGVINLSEQMLLRSGQ